MTREEQAIEYIKKYRELDEKLYNTAPKGTVSSIATNKCLEFWDMAIKALEQESCDVFDEYGNYKYPSDVELTKPNTATSMPCGDAISRQAVLEMAYDMSEIDGEHFTEPHIVVDVEDIQKLPPVNPTKTGHWIEHPEIETSTPEYLMFYECSECGDRQCFCKSDIHKKRFCSNCGCRMG